MAGGSFPCIKDDTIAAAAQEQICDHGGTSPMNDDVHASGAFIPISAFVKSQVGHTDSTGGETWHVVNK